MLDGQARSSHGQASSDSDSSSDNSSSDTSSDTDSEGGGESSRPKSVPAERTVPLFQSSLCREMLDVLTNPYESQSLSGSQAPATAEGDAGDKYYRPTPKWAVGMPGVAFMS